MITIVSCEGLPPELNHILKGQKVDVHEHYRLVLIGSGGKTLWNVLKEQGKLKKNAIEEHCAKVVQLFMDTCLKNASVYFLFPAPHTFPIQQLSRWAGVSSLSPLGIDIHPVYGIWSAHRAIFLTDADLPLIPPSTQRSPCETCVEKPCIPTCPVTAVKAINAFDLKACTDFRVSPHSICAHQCLSRLACPIAPEHRYSSEQIRYHYTHSLKSIRRYRAFRNH